MRLEDPDDYGTASVIQDQIPLTNQEREVLESFVAAWEKNGSKITGSISYGTVANLLLRFKINFPPTLCKIIVEAARKSK